MELSSTDKRDGDMWAGTIELNSIIISATNQEGN